MRKSSAGKPGRLCSLEGFLIDGLIAHWAVPEPGLTVPCASCPCDATRWNVKSISPVTATMRAWARFISTSGALQCGNPSVWRPTNERRPASVNKYQAQGPCSLGDRARRNLPRIKPFEPRFPKELLPPLNPALTGAERRLRIGALLALLASSAGTLAWSQGLGNPHEGDFRVTSSATSTRPWSTRLPSCSPASTTRR